MLCCDVVTSKIFPVKKVAGVSVKASQAGGRRTFAAVRVTN